MYKLILLITIFTLGACSTVNKNMEFVNKSPRGISILNIKKEDRSRAYQAAEKHCAKYSKVPRILSSKEQAKSDPYDEMEKVLRTTVFECLRPSN